MKNEFWFKIRNWQLFLLMLFGPIIMFFISIFVITYLDIDIDGMLVYTFSYYLVFLLWCNSIIVNFNDKESLLTENEKKWTNYYYTYLIVYAIIMIILSFLKVQSSFIATIDTFLHLFMAFSVFAIAFLAAKTFMYKKHKEKVSTGSIIVTMIVMVMMPIGVWIIQPKLNQYLTDITLNKRHNR